MKRIICSIAFILLLAGCNTADVTDVEKPKQTQESTISTPSDTLNNSNEDSANLEKTVEETIVEENNEASSSIDTSIFDLAKEVKVTDARDLTQHITLQIILNDGVKQGNGVQGVLTQTYDFLQQEDIAGAETITIFVNSGQLKIFQATIDKSEFKTNDDISMIQLVLDAAEIEKMTDEVKAYGEVLELW